MVSIGRAAMLLPLLMVALPPVHGLRLDSQATRQQQVANATMTSGEEAGTDRSAKAAWQLCQAETSCRCFAACFLYHINRDAYNADHRMFNNDHSCKAGPRTAFSSRMNVDGWSKITSSKATYEQYRARGRRGSAMLVMADRFVFEKTNSIKVNPFQEFHIWFVVSDGRGGYQVFQANEGEYEYARRKSLTWEYSANEIGIQPIKNLIKSEFTVGPNGLMVGNPTVEPRRDDVAGLFIKTYPIA